MTPYLRRVQYYETDMMGITHHANYIHWMEEARIDFMDQLGFPYAELEKRGIHSPVKSISCDYRHPCTFNDILSIKVSVEAFTGARLILRYEMKKSGTGELVCSAKSEHVFTDENGRILRLRRENPELSSRIESLCVPGETAAHSAPDGMA